MYQSRAIHRGEPVKIKFEGKRFEPKWEVKIEEDGSVVGEEGKLNPRCWETCGR